MLGKFFVRALFIFLGIFLLAPVSLHAWYDGSWLNRKVITFTKTASTENLTNFPILVKLTASNFDFSKAQSGEDIRFMLMTLRS